MPMGYKDNSMASIITFMVILLAFAGVGTVDGFIATFGIALMIVSAAVWILAFPGFSEKERASMKGGINECAESNHDSDFLWETNTENPASPCYLNSKFDKDRGY